MKDMLKRMAIVAALVASLVAIGGQQASADQLCLRGWAFEREIQACVPML